MKVRPARAAVLALAAFLACAPGALPAGQDRHSERLWHLGLKGGLSLRTNDSGSAAYPGVYPSRPVFGVFYEVTDEEDPQRALWLEVLYLDQAASSEVPIRDPLGNVVETRSVTCTRKYLEFIFGGKLRAKPGPVVPFLLCGGALSVLLKTTRVPDIVDPRQPKFHGPVVSGVVGLGVEAALGGLLIGVDARLDWEAERIFSYTGTPKPNTILFVLGIGF